MFVVLYVSFYESALNRQFIYDLIWMYWLLAIFKGEAWMWLVPLNLLVSLNNMAMFPFLFLYLFGFTTDEDDMQELFFPSCLAWLANNFYYK